MNKFFLTTAVAFSFILVSCGEDDGTNDPVDNEPVDHTVITDDAAQPDNELTDDELIDNETPDTDATTGMPAYCILTANADFAYIYDGNGDIQAQLNANPSGYLWSAIFTGAFGDSDKPVPPAAATKTIAFSYHLAADSNGPAQVIVTQQSFDDNSAVISPFVQMSPPSDVVTPGQFSVDVSKSGSGYVLLANSLGAANCLLAYSFGGTITVTAASDTDQASGGSLAFNGADLKLYYPTETPVGDITSQLGGGQVCPKE